MAKSDSYLSVVTKKFTKPRDRTDDVGAVYSPEFPDVQLSLAQLPEPSEVASSTDAHSSKGSKGSKGSRNSKYSKDDGSVLSKEPSMTHERSSGDNSANGEVLSPEHAVMVPNNFQWWWNSFDGPGNTRRLSLESTDMPKMSGKSWEEIYSEGSANRQPRGCLFVAGYPTVSSDEDIIELLWIQFSRWGMVDNIKLTFTNTGVPFGFVYFQDYRSAETFLRESDRVYIRRSLLRVEDARVNRSIYVTHMDGSQIHGQTLALQLERHGKVLALDYDEAVHISPNRGAWLVRYSTWDEAIAAHNWLASQGCWCLEWGAQVGQSGQTIIYNLIYVDGLDSRIVDRKMVIGMFQQYGEIRSANLVCRSATSFAFIEYFNPLSSFRAIRGCHEMAWLGQVIRVQHYRRSPLRSFQQ